MFRAETILWLAAAAPCACSAADDALPRAWIEFDAAPNLASSCAAKVSSFTVSNRETATSVTARCEQAIVFVNLEPQATYNFDIVGYNGSMPCWQGSCRVRALVGGTLADCSAEIAHICS